MEHASVYIPAYPTWPASASHANLDLTPRSWFRSSAVVAAAVDTALAGKPAYHYNFFLKFQDSRGNAFGGLGFGVLGFLKIGTVDVQEFESRV